MQKFSDFIKEQKLINAKKEIDEKAKAFNESYEAKLKELGVTSPTELNESQRDEFFEYLKTLKTDSKAVNEKEIKNEKDFTAYAEDILKKAHGEDYDQKIADKVISDLIKDKKDEEDWGTVIGRLTSGFGK